MLTVRLLHRVRVAFLDAVRFLTRIPAPSAGALARGQLCASVWAFPVVGAGVGLLAAGVYGAAVWAGLSGWVAAALALAATAWVTGALHEDGLADTADGLGGGRDPASRRAIMRDSRIGAYGALALILSVLVRAGALAAVMDALSALAALVAAHAWSRAQMALWMRLFPAAGEASDAHAGLAAHAGRPAAPVAAVALGLGIGAGALFGPLGWLGTGVALGLGLAAPWILARAAAARLGGRVTGDVLGASQQVSEAAVLLTVAAWL